MLTIFRVRASGDVERLFDTADEALDYFDAVGGSYAFIESGSFYTLSTFLKLQLNPIWRDCMGRMHLSELIAERC